MSVCDIFKDLQKFGSSQVVLTGEVYVGEEVFALGVTDCPNRFTTSGHRWPTAVNLEWGSSFPQDAVTQSFRDAVRRRVAQPVEKHRVLEATILGRLAVRTSYRLTRTNYGISGNGYGHLGSYPAELLIERIIRVRER
jgi:hypothetical protein